MTKTASSTHVTPMVLTALLACLVGGQTGTTQAEQAQPLAQVSIVGAWVRAMPPSQTNTAAYLKVHNSGNEPLRILGATVGPTAQVEMHNSRMVDGMMRMEPVESLELAPGKSIQFAPGGMHLMIMGLEKMPAPGEQVKLCLEIESQAPVCAAAEVRKVAPSADDAMHNHQHH